MMLLRRGFIPWRSDITEGLGVKCTARHWDISFIFQNRKFYSIYVDYESSGSSDTILPLWKRVWQCQCKSPQSHKPPPVHSQAWPEPCLARCSLYTYLQNPSISVNLTKKSNSFAASFALITVSHFTNLNGFSSIYESDQVCHQLSLLNGDHHARPGVFHRPLQWKTPTFLSIHGEIGRRNVNLIYM